ncbi:MAG: DUF11 domain-containing protein [Anaerolineae bacterium]|nr:DUF11 domain-containing protein [Anaerolineae bacterium]
MAAYPSARQARRPRLVLDVLLVLSLLLGPTTPAALAVPHSVAGAVLVHPDNPMPVGKLALQPTTASPEPLAVEASVPPDQTELNVTTALSPTTTVSATVIPTATLTPTVTPTHTLTPPPDPTTTATPLPPLPSLSLAVTVTPTAVMPGQTVTFTLVTSNLGSAPATGLVLSDTLPAGLSYVPGSAPGAVYDPEERLLTWQVPELGRNQALTLTLEAEVTAASGERLANLAALSAADGSGPVTATVTLEVGWVAAPDQALITPQEGGVLNSADGWLEVDVRPGRWRSL